MRDRGIHERDIFMSERLSRMRKRDEEKEIIACERRGCMSEKWINIYILNERKIDKWHIP